MSAHLILCPVDGCGHQVDFTAPSVPAGALAGVFGPGVLATTAAAQHARRVEDELVQHLNDHTVVEFVATIAGLREGRDATARERDELCDTVATLRGIQDSQADIIDQLSRERDEWKREALGKYPTQWAYDQACAALEKHRRRADAAEAERDHYREHSIRLNTIAWKIAVAVGDVPEGVERVEGDPEEQADRLIAERDQLLAEAEDYDETVVGDLNEKIVRLTRAEARMATECDHLRLELKAAHIAARHASDLAEQLLGKLEEASAVIFLAGQQVGLEDPAWVTLDDFDGSGDACREMERLGYTRSGTGGWHASKLATPGAEATPEPCPTCSPPYRETVGMVCQACGTDYAPAEATPDEPAPSDETWRDYTLHVVGTDETDVSVLCRSDSDCMESIFTTDVRYLTLGEAVDWAKAHHAGPMHAEPAEDEPAPGDPAQRATVFCTETGLPCDPDGVTSCADCPGPQGFAHEIAKQLNRLLADPEPDNVGDGDRWEDPRDTMGGHEPAPSTDFDEAEKCQCGHRRDVHGGQDRLAQCTLQPCHCGAFRHRLPVYLACGHWHRLPACADHPWRDGCPYNAGSDCDGEVAP